MLVQFVFAVFATLLFVILPGYLLLRSLRCERFLAAVFAPFLTILAYVILGIAFSKVGIFSSGSLYLVVVLSLAVALYTLSQLVQKRVLKAGSYSAVYDSPSVSMFALYVGVSIALGCFFFLGNLSSLDAIFQAYDNIFHLAVIRSFADSGCWSILNVSMYGAANFTPPLSSGGFYPAGWHILCVMLMTTFGFSEGLAVNAANFTFAFLLFPMAMLALLQFIFKGKKEILVFGAVAILAFGSFPWKFLSWGPLFPNLTSFVLAPLLILSFMLLVQRGQRLSRRLLWGFVFFVGVVCLATLQPNAVFTAAVFLAPYCVYQIYVSSKVKFGKRKAVIFSLLFVLFVCSVWYLLYKAPFLQSTLSQLYPSYHSKVGAVAHFLSLWFFESTPNIVLGCLVIVGGVYTLKYRQYLWLTLVYIIVAAMYFVDAACGETSFIKNLLTGFWYSDLRRIEGMVALFGIPLVTLGLYASFKGVISLVKNKIADHKIMHYGLPCFLVLSVVLLFLPISSSVATTQFGRVSDNMNASYALSSDTILSADEAEFLSQVKDITADDLVINVPDDGSSFAYPLANINTYYRNTRTYGTSGESEESREIRENLCNVDSSSSVKNALQEIDAQYLLLLDQGQYDEMPHLFTWDVYESQWKGISQISDNTPGFKVVLAEGDMRLYEIVSSA